MQFRHFLLSGLMVGAALLLPNNAFAEKNDHSGQENSQKTSVLTEVSEKMEEVQTKVQTKAENAKSMKNTPVEPASKPKAEIKEQPIKASSHKAAETLENLPEKAKGNLQSVIKKTVKDIKSPGLEQVEVVKKHVKGVIKNKKASQKKAGNSTLDSLHNTDTVGTNIQTEDVVQQTKSQGKSLLASQKESKPKTLVSEEDHEKKVPTSKREVPEADQAPTPTQRTNSTGGTSHDRAGHGLSTVSFFDKWFEWNKFYEIELIQPFLSRKAFMNNQWVNAPPAPPPKEAPFYKNVNRC
ncbi:hypothetical protein [Neobacillus sp. D3-1R]|uniref:hypothetical protein n=1 Tax=Neobacillus sp. D3-1R TaxID=3445778 RepID=UPI003FA05443